MVNGPVSGKDPTSGVPRIEPCKLVAATPRRAGGRGSGDRTESGAGEVHRHGHQTERGYLTTDLVVGLAILSLALLPLSYGFQRERRLAAAAYYRAVVMEIVDGEMEALRAGEWRLYGEGSQPYTVTAEAAANLPPGRFELVRSTHRLRLEWRPLQRGFGSGSPVVREVALP